MSPKYKLHGEGGRRQTHRFAVDDKVIYSNNILFHITFYIIINISNITFKLKNINNQMKKLFNIKK